MVYNNLGISGHKEFLTWFTLRTILKRDKQYQRNFVIILMQADMLSQNLQKWIQTKKRNLKPIFTTLELLCSSPQSLGKSATSLDSVTRGVNMTVRAELYILCKFDCTILRYIAIN